MNVYKVKVTNSCLLFRTLWFSVFNTTKNKQRDTWYLASWYFKIVSNFELLTISKYHSWYLCQISTQTMLLPILILLKKKTNIHYLTSKTQSTHKAITKLWIKINVAKKLIWLKQFKNYHTSKQNTFPVNMIIIWPFLTNANTYVFKIRVMDHDFLFELFKKP